MLKHNDIFQWRGFGDDEVFKRRIMRSWISQCNRCIYEMPEQYVVIFSESRGEPYGSISGVRTSVVVVNEGTSITNSFEYIATLTVREFPYLWEKPVVWIEHYDGELDSEGEGGMLGDGKETFDKVVLQWNDREQRFHAPKWTHSSRREVDALLREEGEKK